MDAQSERAVYLCIQVSCTRQITKQKFSQNLEQGDNTTENVMFYNNLAQFNETSQDRNVNRFFVKHCQMFSLKTNNLVGDKVVHV